MIRVGGGDDGYLLFRCPGCRELHQIHTNANGWTWNGSIEQPTFNPSVLVQCPGHPTNAVCHSFVRDGRIEFLSDSTHALAGRTVELVDVTG